MTENKGDLISREALKKSFEDTVCIEPMPYAFVKQIIDNAPTVAPERPQGKWIKIGEIGLAYKCDKCDEVNVIPENFCPNCGADMRGKDI